MENVRISGQLVDVIELFDDHILVQNPATGATFLAGYDQIDPLVAVKCNDRCESNVISLRDWSKRWPRKQNAKNKKPRRRQQAEPKVLPLVR